MYCPKCGQQQPSEDGRFCSRCGLSLVGLPEWLAYGGLPAILPPEGQVISLSQRRKRIRQGAKLMFVSGVIFPLAFIWALADDSPAVLIVPFIIFLLGLAWTLYGRLFSEVTESPAPDQGKLMQRSIKALSPISSQEPITKAKPRSWDTGEITSPPSVTEHTTKLLE